MNWKALALVSAAALPLAGCETFWSGHGAERQRHGASSSLVDYLYPNGEVPPRHADELPFLKLPLRVGIAFVPSPNYGELSAAVKHELLDRVSSAFSDRPFVTRIEVIPDVYLKSATGLVGMQQVARMHDVDVMALVSYDQLSLSGERDSAILYWTIVGALVVKGNTNEVQTLIDTAVFDVQSGKLLLRAPGTDIQGANSTMIDRARDLRHLQVEGFEDATKTMIVNLDRELDVFKDQVKNGKRAKVEWQEGHGGGSTGINFAAALLCLLLLRQRQSRSLVMSTPKSQA